jgi:two-component system, LytTR family, sensor kinase
MIYFYNVMDKNLVKRLVKIALFSSPIMALYGVTPVYIFNKIPPAFILVAGAGILLNVAGFWAINIAILRYSVIRSKWRRYLMSYGFIILYHLIFILIRTFVPPPEIFFNEVALFKNGLFIAYPIVSVIAMNTIILIICNSAITSHKNKNAEMEIQELKVSNLEAQKQALLQQLQPHFLFNALSVLKSLIKESPDEAENYSVKLSEFLRYSIQVQKKDMVTVEQELKFTNDYIDLQKVRFGESLICNVSVPDGVDHLLIPAFAVQTLVENAIKHNSFTDKRPLVIKISYADHLITVCNNKMLSKAVETTGTGLKNLNQRYKIIGSREIIIADEKDEFNVSVPLLNEK